MLSVEQVAKKLQVSTRTIYYWVEKRKIPYYKIGQGLRFDETEIEEWIKQKRVPPISPEDMVSRDKEKLVKSD